MGSAARAGSAALFLVLTACSAGPVGDLEADALPSTGPVTTATISPGTAANPTSAQPQTDSAEPATDPGDGALVVEPVVWGDCGDGLQCATVAVPLDHDRPAGETIDIALVRVPAGGPDEASGSIFVNPGGPGGSGIAYVRTGFRLDDDTMADYHLVGFDPRGVGASAPLACDIDLTAGPRLDLSPDSGAEWAALDRQARTLAERCDRLDGSRLAQLGTESVIRDLELLRQAVGDPELHYMGLSYGTLIGLRYAERYPRFVGHMVLDGVVDPSSGLADLLRQQADEFERSLQAMDEACGTTANCPVGGIVAGFDRVTERLERSGPVDDVGPTELVVATLVSMYSEGLWSVYGEALLDADGGDLAAIERLHDAYVGSTSHTAYLAVLCIDGQPPSGAEGWDRLVDELAARSPRFGAALANEVRSCAYWPARSAIAPEPVSAAGSEPILVLSTTGDAPTPLVNAATVAAGLASAGLVVVEDEGHTAYGRSFCVQRIVRDYFAIGTVPDTVHRC